MTLPAPTPEACIHCGHLDTHHAGVVLATGQIAPVCYDKDACHRRALAKQAVRTLLGGNV